MDFSRLHTYGWRRGSGDFEMDELTARRVREAVEAELTKKGYRKTDEAPDFLVTAYGGKKRNAFIADWGYRRRWARGVDVYRYDVGTLVVDVIEPGENVLIWRGVVRTELGHDPTPERRTEVVTKAIGEVLAPFPPTE